ncbi:reverse transcriptase domain-containing protein [Tanacetum coccineum]
MDERSYNFPTGSGTRPLKRGLGSRGRSKRISRSKDTHRRRSINEIYYHSNTFPIQHHFGAFGPKAAQSHFVHHLWDDEVPNSMGNCNAGVPGTYNIQVQEGRKELVMIGKGLSPEGSMQLKNLLKRNKDIFAWEPADMTRVPKESSNIPSTPTIRPVKYPTWISNPVLVKKVDGSWRMCIDFKNINFACPKDYYSLPEIDSKIESVVGFPLKCFLDAYKGYHQVHMAEEDEEKTTFYTDQGTYCYTKMLFGLKNTGATYQRLVDKAFQSQIRRNLEVYVDDMVVKSKSEREMLADIAETFDNLKRINMKLNLKSAHLGSKKESS